MTPWYEDLMEGPLVEVLREAMVGRCCRKGEWERGGQRAEEAVELYWTGLG